MTTQQTPKTYYSVTETAELVRSALKKHFPGIKFSVRSSSYSGGASIDVSWSFGPTSKEVQSILDQYESADFDGMIDLETHKEHWLLPDGSAIVRHASGTEGSMGLIPPEDNPPPPGAVPVRFGADFVHGARRFYYKDWQEEQALVERVARAMCDLNHAEWKGPQQTAHLFGQGDTEPATRHAWRLLSMTSFKPGEEFESVRWATDAEREGFDETRTGMVIVKKSPAPVIPVASAATGVIVRENRERAGIEIKFPGKPSAAILALLKSNGWRWNRASLVWYNRMSQESKEFAEKLADG